jgi:shikimate dehydrogenase
VTRFVLVGHPVSHSISPAIHRAAYVALSLPHRYELVDCADDARLRAVVDELRAGEIGGINVTVPHKLRVLELADRVEPAAADTGAANVLSLREGSVVADNTDVLALEEEIVRLTSDVRAAIIVGSGGAALAAASACRRRGVARTWVTARRFRAVSPADRWPNAEVFRRLGAELVPWPAGGPEALAECAKTADLVVQATSAGMCGASAGEDVSAVLPWAAFRPSALAYDVVYTPAVTPFLDAARRSGLRVAGGLGMLVAQAARALELWFDREVARDVLEDAARRALAEGNAT